MKTNEASEMIILYVVLHRLMTPAEDTDAYKLGLINKNYKLLRDPSTPEEEAALSPLNIFIFKLKRALGTRVITLFRYLYLKVYKEEPVLERLLVRGQIETRSEIRRVKNDMIKDRKSLKG